MDIRGYEPSFSLLKWWVTDKQEEESRVHVVIDYRWRHQYVKHELNASVDTGDAHRNIYKYVYIYIQVSITHIFSLY